MSNKQNFDINTAIPADMEVVDLTHTEKRPTHNQISIGFNRGRYMLSIRNVEIKDERSMESISYILDTSGKNYLLVHTGARFSAKTLATIKERLENRAGEISKYWNEHGLNNTLKETILSWVKG